MNYCWENERLVDGKPSIHKLVNKDTNEVVLMVRLSAYASEKDINWLRFKLKSLMKMFFIRVWSQELRC